MQAASVLEQLAQCRVSHIIWLPDTETDFMYRAMGESQIKLVPVCREGESMAIAAGLIMGGQRPVVLMQSTGFFESGDSIHGMCLKLRLPLLLLLGYRGYAGQGRTPTDSAARYLERLLDAWGIPYHVVASDADCHRISEAYRQAESIGGPVAVLIGPEYDG